MALTNKQQVFVAEYIKDFNASRAAIAAGYSPKTARSIGQENLTKPDIGREIQKAIADRCMTKSEVLVRLAEHARGDIGDFVIVGADGTPGFNFQAASTKGKMHLVKKLKAVKRTYMERGASKGDLPVTEIDVEIELYDAQSALEKIGRHHKLFTDKPQVTSNFDLDKLSTDQLVRIANGEDFLEVLLDGRVTTDKSESNATSPTTTGK